MLNVKHFFISLISYVFVQGINPNIQISSVKLFRNHLSNRWHFSHNKALKAQVLELIVLLHSMEKKMNQEAQGPTEIIIDLIT